MNVRNFSVLYDLLCEELHLNGADTLDTSVLVRVSALRGGQLPVIAWERQSSGGITIRLYHPVSRVAYLQGLDRECTARVNMENLYSARNRAVTGGLGQIEDQHFFYLQYDGATQPDAPDALYCELYQYMDWLAEWLGAPLTRT